jgi:hypothetical protein
LSTGEEIFIFYLRKLCPSYKYKQMILNSAKEKESKLNQVNFKNKLKMEFSHPVIAVWTASKPE